MRLQKCPVCGEKVRRRDFGYHVRQHAPGWCNVCGIVYHRHPGRSETSPPYTLPCAGGLFILLEGTR